MQILVFVISKLYKMFLKEDIHSILIVVQTFFQAINKLYIKLEHSAESNNPVEYDWTVC